MRKSKNTCPKKNKMRLNLLLTLLLLTSTPLAYPQVIHLNDRLYVLDDVEAPLANDSLKVFRYHELIPLSGEAIHLGDEAKDSFNPPNPLRSKTKTYSLYFTSLPEHTLLTYDAFDVDFGENEIVVNGIFSGYVCKTKARRRCEQKIKSTYFKAGRNTLSFNTNMYSRGRGYDDYVLSNVNVKVNYSQRKPQIVPVRAIHPTKPSAGEVFTVALSLINIGVEPAYNITVRDVTLHPQEGAYRLRPFEGEINVLSGLNHYRRAYNLSLSQPGNYTLPEGEVFYHDDGGSLHSSAIKQASFTVSPLNPEISFILNKTHENTGYVNLTLTLENNGQSGLQNILIKTETPLCLEIIGGSLNASIHQLSRGEVVTLTAEAEIQPSCESMFSSSIQYEDELGADYWMKSNYVEFNQKKQAPSLLSERVLLAILILILATAAALYLIYLRVS
ncbi:MAG: hypothetical protein GF334_04595 [Candidatus Altiarchaeales archaeon]|nr:hypothetical protein [Candidatus Altiarchaeales archaeon]